MRRREKPIVIALSLQGPRGFVAPTICAWKKKQRRENPMGIEVFDRIIDVTDGIQKERQ